MTKIQWGIISGLILLIFVGAGVSVAVGIHHNNQKSETVESSTKKKQQTKDNQKVTEAQQLFKEYRYDEANALLANENSKAAKKLASEIEETQKNLVEWKDPGNISHLFFHSLIVDAQKAFTDPQQAEGYWDYMVTIPEFNKIMDQLYANNYVLVSFQQLVSKDANGQLQFNGVSLPAGKKPLILSIDDVSYYQYMKGAGFPEKLEIVNNQVKNLYTDGGKDQVGDYDVVPLVDDFVKQHPDFSYQGAKGILAMTGYNGVLGYRTSKSEYGDNATTDNEITEAKKVVAKLKETGWIFASHSWGHINMTKASLASIQADMQRWKDEVEPIVGETDILVYPHGADISDFMPYTEQNQKFTYLKSQGFDIFCNVDASVPAWGQFTGNYYRNARINVDGLRFKSDFDGQDKVLDNFFNVSEVYDTQARAIYQGK